MACQDSSGYSYKNRSGARPILKILASELHMYLGVSAISVQRFSRILSSNSHWDVDACTWLLGSDISCKRTTWCASRLLACVLVQRDKSTVGKQSTDSGNVQWDTPALGMSFQDLESAHYFTVFKYACILSENVEHQAHSKHINHRKLQV